MQRLAEAQRSAANRRLPPRVTIENVTPQVAGGKFAIKRTAGERVVVEADVFADGHDLIAGVVLFRPGPGETWHESPLEPVVNDRWRGGFVVTSLGTWEYTVEAWIDEFATWRRKLQKKFDAGQDVSLELREGVELISAASSRASQHGSDGLREVVRALQQGHPADAVARALEPTLGEAMRRAASRERAQRYEPVLLVHVERERARYGAWYELFPRSTAPEPGRHGTLADVITRLDYVAALGFDVLYLPPIHPIGQSFRKGPNNTLDASPDDVGSPWAIGSEAGGHTAIHPALGTLEDFDRLQREAARRGLEIALDIAFQCSPDHPWVREHPDWFRQRPDGSIQYAENPPKQYQDIYPLDFECDRWEALWDALRDVLRFWAHRGVRVFRVDNPHTKALPFWTWVLNELRREFPDVVTLSEAFTRPKVMKHLAAAGFSQSYSYFTWRNTKAELTEYFTELYLTETAEYLRPNLFANTPDIDPEFLQSGLRAAFLIRVALAATLGANYGIYGPVFEQCVGEPVRPGSEEYRDSEKYQIRHWTWDPQAGVGPWIARLNQIRREHAALQFDRGITFLEIDNEQMLAFRKTTPDGADTLIVVVSLDPHHSQSGFLQVPIEDWGIAPGGAWQVHDLIGDARYVWHGSRNYVRLDPAASPAHVFQVRKKLKTEQDFDYYL